MKKLFRASIIALLASFLSAYFISRAHAVTVVTNAIQSPVKFDHEIKKLSLI